MLKHKRVERFIDGGPWQRCKPFSLDKDLLIVTMLVAE